MGRQLAYIAAINEAISQEMARDSSVLYFGQNIATTENDEFLKAFGGDRVRVTGRWSSCTWPSSCSWPWTRW